ncbi:MAG: molybdopterin-dependent oxidoreductase [Lachnospiraceae bacterium]|nr:molybdopterin-dependent oxidoreductase [Lachnospiraceae bacterium]
MAELKFTLNGRPHTAKDVPADRTLLKYLREDLNLTGTKEGCRQGECGACTVLINGEPVNACMVYMGSLEGADVLTIEGLAKNGELDKVQKAFVDCGAIQCGFCSPGMIMTVKALLMKNPTPTEDEIRHAISGNLCRCTGYKKIVQAARVAAGLEEAPDGAKRGGQHVVGRNAARRDTVAKAQGKAVFADDFRIPGLLIARAKRSPYASALIKKIDLEKAKTMPGVVTILTAEDIPGLPFCGQVYKDMPVICRDKVRNQGDPVAVVIAETEELADAAVKEIQVEYEPLPVIRDVHEALQEGAYQIHDSGNLRQIFNIRKGDADEAFEKCAAVVENVYKTALQEHAFIETECSVAYYDPNDGYLTVLTPTQEVYSDRRQIAASLALPQNAVRVIQAVTGGAFGGKIDISTEIIAALGCMKTLRPVKYRYSREESMAVSTKRHPYETHIKIGADENGKILAMKATVYCDNGAYSSMGAKVVQKGCCNLTGPYNIPNVSVDSFLVYTNRPFGGAMRGFGIPQAEFACESAVEELACKMGIPGDEFRRINATHIGDTTPTGMTLRSANITEHIDAAMEYLKAHPYPYEAPPAEHVVRGTGIAAFIYPIGLGYGTNDSTTVICRLCDDGSVLVVSGAADLGQGSNNVLARITAEELGTTEDNIRVRTADTAYTPFAGLSSGSRQTYVSGRAAMEAARQVRGYMARGAAEMLRARPEAISFAENKVYINGVETEKTFQQVASYCYGHAIPQMGTYRADITTKPVDMETGQGDPFADFVYGAHAADVEVNTETGKLDVKRIVAVHDVGHIINPIGLQGQIDGAISMGYGQAVMEEVLTKDGHLVTPSFAEYMIPTSEDSPETVFIPLETPSDFGPYGARGMAEPAVVGVAPAICNAIYHACGVRVTEVPITQERLKALLDAKRREEAK